MSASQQLLLGGAQAAVPNYIEDVFSTWLYASTTTDLAGEVVNNGIDLAGKGGLVWLKNRSEASSHFLTDTARGPDFEIRTNTDAAQVNLGGVTAFLSTGFRARPVGSVGATTASWTFRKQPKFFDVVTYTGNGQDNRQIAHNLGSAPGCIMVKKTNTTGQWFVYHRGLNNGVNAAQYYLNLETTNAQAQYEVWENTNPTSTVFTIDSFSGVNGSGDTYVAYLFAHNAGGFGLSGTDNVISCGSFVGNTAGSVNLGWEPQWMMVKDVASGYGWAIVDNMRGLNNTSNSPVMANSANAEYNDSTFFIRPTATGFEWTSNYGTGSGMIYIAIRRGPMKVPTTGTSVFAPVALNSPGSVPNTLTRTTNFPVDFYFSAVRNQTYAKFLVSSRLQGRDAYLITSETSQETTYGDLINNLWDNNTGVGIFDTNGSWNGNASGQTTILEAFRRAPGFADVVCYTGNGATGRTLAHNLGVVPDLMIVKRRNATAPWEVYVNDATLLSQNRYLELNYDYGSSSSGQLRFGNDVNMISPTSTQFTLGSNSDVNASGSTYVNYLFGSCPGVSKVGTYIGNGGSQTLNMGFTSGARFFLVKRRDSTSDWWVYDSARGILSTADPALRLNNTAAEITSADALDTASIGIVVKQENGCNINVNGAAYIYLGIA